MGKQVKHSWLGSQIAQRFRNRGADSVKNASSPQITPPETSVSVERPATGLKTETKTTGWNIEVEAVAPNDDSIQAKSQRTERVTLPPLIDGAHPKPRVSKAREKLQESTEQLEASLVIYARNFEDRPPFEDADVKNILANGSHSSPLSGDDFGRFIDQVLSDQKTDTSSVRGRVAACMSKVYPIATFALGIVSFAGDAAGFLPLKITANGLTQVISLASKEHSRSEDIISALDNLSSHQSFFEDLRDIGAEELPPSVQEHATLLLAAIAGYLRISLDFLQSHYVGKIVKIIGRDDVGEAQKAVDLGIADLDRAVGRETYLLGKRREQREKLENARNSLSKLNFRDKHNDVWKRRLGETGQWILSEPEFLKWIDGTVQSIWCTGLPGAGKTFVFSTIVDYITCKEGRGRWKADLKIGVAYIYCSYNDQRAQTLDALLSSVIQQLISSCPTPSQTSDPLLRRALAFQDDHEGHSVATSDYIQLLGEVVGELGRAYVLVDALDECSEVDHSGSNTRATLISVLLNLPLQLLVTSRQLESIRDLFPSTLELPIRPDRRDIQSYIKWRISDPVYGSRKLLRLTQSHEGLQDHIIDEIFLKYSQIFNLVRLQMDHIRDLSTAGELRAALSDLPMREEDFYGQSIMRIRDNSAQRERAMNVLSWVLRARRPMKLHEIIHAVAILPDRSSVTSYLDFVPPLEDLVDSCEGLVLINHESETMTFAHPTIKEYLEKTSHSPFDIDPEINISQACLTYLLFEEMKDLTTRSIFQNESSKYPLLDYSSTHWSTHVHGKPEQVYIEIIMRLLHQHSRSGSVLPGLRDPDYEDPLWYDGSFDIMRGGLWMASALGLEDAVARLIKMGAEIETDSGYQRRRALHLAAERRYFDIAKMLLEAGADVEANSKYGRTALHLAAYNNDAALTKYLLDAGANIQARGKHEESPLHICAMGGFLETAGVLLEANADIEAKAEGATPVQIAWYEDQTEMVRFLLKAGAKTDFRKGWRLREDFPEFFEGQPSD